ncbi:MAG: AraC family transcriptional regulator [Pedobacter sp.]|nr:MAG: AraC family transcriptional regulator [Pedobacter sp.]
MEKELKFQLIQPEEALADFVYCFTSLQNFSPQAEAVIFPNGKVDLVFASAEGAVSFVALLGLETLPKYTNAEVSGFFSVSFHPLAIEYLFEEPIADIVNTGRLLPNDFWGIVPEDLNSFEGFTSKITQKILELLPVKIDERKRQLFKLVVDSNGEIPVRKISETVFWSERQINRYFNRQFGLSLKEYCKILRFQASLTHIQKGELYPQLNFTDQSHFIKEIKHLSGVSPKELYKNENDRFLQFLASAKK